MDHSTITAHAGVPLLIELFRAAGGATVMDVSASSKVRRRSLSASETVESLFALWAAGRDRCEDMDALREDEALRLMLGHDLPAAQTVRDFLLTFHKEELPLLQSGDSSSVPSESSRLQGLSVVNAAVVRDLQSRRPRSTATLDVDASIIESDKRSARRTCDGRRGFQHLFALWAEQNLIVADEFRDGNVPAGSGNHRVVERAVSSLPPGVTTILQRGDSALYEHDLMRWLDERSIEYAISADMGRELRAAVESLPESAWATDAEETEAIR